MRTGIIVCFLCFFVSKHAFAEFVSDDEDTTKHKVTFDPELNAFLEWNKVVNRNIFAAAETNLLINQKIIIGLHGEYFLGDLIKRVVFPNFYSLDKYMYGVNLGYHFPINERLDITPQMKYAFSYMKWTELEQQRYYLEDHFIEMRPEIIVNYNLFKCIYLRAGVGYTIVNGLDLSGIKVEEIDGLNFSTGFGIRFINP